VTRSHRHELAVHQGQAPVPAVHDAQASSDDPTAHVEGLPVLEDVDVGEVEPAVVPRRVSHTIAVGIGRLRIVVGHQPEGQRQPVGQVHEVFVGDLVAPDRRLETVVQPRDVRARVVHAIRNSERRGAARGEVSVGGRAQRLAQPLLLGVVAIVVECPRRHQSASSRTTAGTRPRRPPRVEQAPTGSIAPDQGPLGHDGHRAAALSGHATAYRRRPATPLGAVTPTSTVRCHRIL
jgi:hypothetical protein